MTRGALIAIDPGVVGGGCACACCIGGTLEGVWFERVQRYTRDNPPPAKGPAAVGSGISLVLVERPEYQGDRSLNARVQDLMALCWEGAILAGAFAGRDGCPIVELPPSVWKGTEPKPMQHARLWACLTAGERAILGGDRTAGVIHEAREKGALDRWSKPGAAYYPRSFRTHNLLDAAAMGAVYLNRLECRA